jgi:tetratricopeptide (TPR) repeat protein
VNLDAEDGFRHATNGLDKRTMDRTNFNVWAGILAAIGALGSGGCDIQSTRQPTTGLQALPQVRSESPASISPAGRRASKAAPTPAVTVLVESASSAGAFEVAQDEQREFPVAGGVALWHPKVTRVAVDPQIKSTVKSQGDITSTTAVSAQEPISLATANDAVSDAVDQQGASGRTADPAVTGDVTRPDPLKLNVSEQDNSNRVTMKADAADHEANAKQNVAQQEPGKSATTNTTTPKRGMTPLVITAREDASQEASKLRWQMGSGTRSATATQEPTVAKQKPAVAKHDVKKRKASAAESAKVETSKQIAAKPNAAKPEVAKLEVAKQETLKRAITPVMVTPREIPQGEISQHDAPLTDAQQRIIPSREISNQPAPPRRSPEMMATISRADQQVAHGFQLAERGAIYLARAEFTAALKVIAQAFDMEQGTRENSKAVTAGLVALKESTDFVRQTGSVEDANIARIVPRHQTSVLKGADVSDMAPTTAAEAYYAFAQQQLSTAAGRERVASMALYGLGRATTVGAGNNAHQLEYTGQAMVYYQAALQVEPTNFRAANELGVLLANHGQLQQARDMLTRSASLAPNAVTWRNLAMVHNRMGDRQMGEQLQGQAAEMQRSSKNSATPNVQWVDPAMFASVTSSTDGLTPPTVAPKTEPTPAKAAAEPAKPPANVAKRITDLIPLNLRRS